MSQSYIESYTPHKFKDIAIGQEFCLIRGGFHKYKKIREAVALCLTCSKENHNELFMPDTKVYKLARYE